MLIRISPTVLGQKQNTCILGPSLGGKTPLVPTRNIIYVPASPLPIDLKCTVVGFLSGIFSPDRDDF